MSVISTDGTSTGCPASSCDDTEQNLDMTQALGMAPGLKSLVVYVGNTDTAIISAMTTHSPLPTTIGCSWGWTPADPSTLDPYFQKMAAQGQNFFAASGDSSTWSKRNEAWPADDAYVVSVGGTDLVTASAAGPWKSETAWVDSGGGISPDNIAIPSWQKLSGVINSSNKGSTTLRNGPDVSANANFTFYTCANQKACLANSYGGTSFAAPMWAGYIALVNQQLVANGQPTIGFINPTIYAQNVTSSYGANFHDVTSGTSGAFCRHRLRPRDGLGKPDSRADRRPFRAHRSHLRHLCFTWVRFGAAGEFRNVTISTSAANGFDSAVALSASGYPAGVTPTFTPTSIAAPGTGNSTLNLAVASSVAAGTYTITVTGTGGGVTQTTTVTLTVTAPAPAYTISASPKTLSISRGSSGSATISAQVTGGTPTIALSATGQENRVTVGFSPTSITGSTTSKMTVTVNRRAATGTFTITITGTSGAVKQSTTVTVTVK